MLLMLLMMVLLAVLSVLFLIGFHLTDFISPIFAANNPAEFAAYVKSWIALGLIAKCLLKISAAIAGKKDETLDIVRISVLGGVAFLLAAFELIGALFTFAGNKLKQWKSNHQKKNSTTTKKECSK